MDAGNVAYSASGESTVDGNVVTFNGNGTVEVTATSGDVSTVSEHYVYDMPDEIVVMANQSRVSELTLQNGGVTAFSAEAYVGYNKLISGSGSFKYAVEGNIGTISADGVFTAQADRTATGNVIITGGRKSVSVPVKVVNDDYIFYDVTSHWAKEMIRDMARAGVVNGYEDSNGLAFLPDNNITRAEFAVMLAGYLKLDLSAYENAGQIFDDDIPDWAESAAAAMYELGYISGVQDGSKLLFAANAKLTRAEAAAMIGRTLPTLTEEAELTFTDASNIPAWARTFTARLVKAGVLSGYDDNTVKPLNNVTRAEAVTLLYKVSCL